MKLSVVNILQKQLGYFPNGLLTHYGLLLFYLIYTHFTNLLTGLGQGDVYANAVYTGEWLNSTRTGFGELRYENGSRYIGYWDHNKRYGCGNMT